MNNPEIIAIAVLVSAMGVSYAIHGVSNALDRLIDHLGELDDEDPTDPAEEGSARG